MDIHNINTIARYEVKLLKRSWLFRIFALVVLLLLTLIQFSMLSPVFWRFQETWPYSGLTSFIPFFTIYFYNIAQSVIVIFLAGSFLKRDKKLDTAEVIYVRPMSNADYILGKVWGITRVFIGLNLITLLIAAFINLVINQSPFSPFPYLFYLFTISLPSLWFVLGLSFMTMCLLKNQAVTFIVMLGITGTIFFYLPEKWYGVFDFFGVNISAIFSDVMGHAHLDMFLWQRSIYFLLGIGLICLTIVLVKRLPHRPWKTVLVSVLALVLVSTGLLTGFLYVKHYQHIIVVRSGYADVYNRYAGLPKANVISNDLDIEQQGNQLEGVSRLVLQNKRAQVLDTLILFLNPALKVSSVKTEEGNVHFVRDKQAVILNYPLLPGQQQVFTIHYQGGIEENICYTDVEDEEFLAHTKAKTFNFRYGKRYVYMDDRFTLLTPECVWYPVTEAPAYPAVPYNIRKNFTYYTLTVAAKTGKKVLSQGEESEAEGKVRFRNSQPLPGISLTIADYEKMSMAVDSVDYELYYFRGHDFFSKYFEKIRDTLPQLVREFRNGLEVEKNRAYPFRKFVLAEAPVQYTGYVRNWKGYTEEVMPEIVFVPERGITTSADFRASQLRTKEWRRRDMAMEDIDVQIEMLRNYVQNTFTREVSSETMWDVSPEVNKLNITAMFFGFTGFISSEKFPVADIALTTLQNATEQQRRGWFMSAGITDQQRANLYLVDKSFEMALADRTLKPQVFYEMLKLKSNYLKNYIVARIPQKRFAAFLRKFSDAHRFQEISLEEFAAAFQKEFQMDFLTLLEKWYREDHTAMILLQDADANKVVVEDFTKYQFRLRAWNPSDVDAVVSVKVESGGGRRGGFRMGGRSTETEDNSLHYIIPARNACEIKIINDDRPGRVVVNTNVSRNLPNEFIYNFSKVDNEIADTTQGIFPIDSLLFAPETGDIIIDNEDPGFHTVEGNQKHKLKDLFRKKSEDKYKPFQPWRFPSVWTPIINNTCYGLPVNSAVHRKKGMGNNKAVWTAQIPGDNYYEIWVWNPKLETWWFGGRRHRNENNQTYVIKSEGGEETVTVDLNQGDNGWVSLGSFYLSAGEATVTLTDKVSGAFVVADAVKFSLIRNR